MNPPGGGALLMSAPARRGQRSPGGEPMRDCRGRRVRLLNPTGLGRTVPTVAFGLKWLAVIAFVLATTAPCAVRAQDSPKIRVVTEGAYPPFNLIDAKGRPAGFEPDLVRALCAAAGLECTIETEEWEALFDGLMRRSFDAVISSVEITRERRKRFAVSAPYYRAHSAWLAQKGDLEGPFGEDRVIGRNIGVVGESVQDLYLQKRFGDRVTITRYGSLEEAALDVGADRVDFALLDKFELQKWLDLGRQATCCTPVADAAYDPEIFGEGYGILFRKSDRALRDKFDAALRTIESDGTYETIRSRYFPFDIR